MLLTDPEVESSLLISLDEGATYQKYGLAFDILSLLFHPEQEDWILAYSHEQKVNVSRPRRKYSCECIRCLFSRRFHITRAGGRKKKKKL